ncbi:piRNA biogenesis protein EXD1 [Vitis vinifera]|uniref:PiRNA biogenesis protein EXD1 n=1 Tax=Vitis vinifera TaxID=29760 RepID=A0A438K745_VITVI|nr:piRNA biogenesis protein EXD1 [Vitis vinifera]
MPSVGLDLCSFLYYKCFPGGQHPDHAALLSLVPIYIVTHASQLPKDFLVPSPVRQLVIGFDCEGVDLCRHGSLCIMQLAFPDAIYLVDAIQGGEKLMKACKPALESSYITKVIHDCKRDSEALYFQFGIKLHNVVDSQVSLINITTLFLDKFAASIYCHMLSWTALDSGGRGNGWILFGIGLGCWLLNPSQTMWPGHGSKTTGDTFFAYAISFLLLFVDKRQFLPDISTCMSKQIAYSLIEEQQGRRRSPDDYISFVGLLADPRYCGISYLEKKEVRVLLKQDPKFWTYRPLSELMVRAAADDVRFLPYIYYKMMEELNEHSLWKLAVRGALYCRCFCVNDNEYADWPSLPNMPENLMVDGKAPEEEILSVLEIPQGKMGCVIGRKGASILSIKQCCK